MKKAPLFLLVMFMLMFSCVCYAASSSFLEGDWYDKAGNLVLSIHDGYLNDCQIISFISGAGSTRMGACTLTVEEGHGSRDISLGVRVLGDPHDRLIFDNTALHKADCTHYESVSGVYLGSTAKDVVQALGQPESVSDYSNDIRYSYNSGSLLIDIKYGEVESIWLNSDSTLHFDRSGLNCNSSGEDFRRAYGIRDAIGHREIGKTGEYLHFKGMDGVALSSWPV